MSDSLDNVLLGLEASLADCVRAIDRNGKGIVLLVDDHRHLQGTITDGDIRRAILRGVDLEGPAKDLLDGKPEPVTVAAHTGPATMLELMQARTLRQLPVLDEAGAVTALVMLGDLLPQHAEGALSAVVMAGGFGTRLKPLTDNLPKPMLPVGDRPMLEHIIDQLKLAEVKHVHITTHYKPESIRDHFKDGAEFGVDIQYVHEEVPLGTAGGLTLMERPEETLVVLNGDVISDVDLRAMFHFHQEHKADLTVAVRKYDFEVPFGVVDCEEHRVIGLKEKPVYDFFVNAGIYLLEPSVFDHLPEDHIDMTDLIDRLIQAGREVVSFPVLEYWIDVGRPDDYKRANLKQEQGEPS